jgi:hypothetical protein
MFPSLMVKSTQSENTMLFIGRRMVIPYIVLIPVLFYKYFMKDV